MFPDLSSYADYGIAIFSIAAFFLVMGAIVVVLLRQFNSHIKDTKDLVNNMDANHTALVTTLHDQHSNERTEWRQSSERQGEIANKLLSNLNDTLKESLVRQEYRHDRVIEKLDELKGRPGDEQAT